MRQALNQLRSRLRARARRAGYAAAAPAGVVTRLVIQATPGIAGLVMLAYGAHMAWPPAGWMVAGAAVLADVTWSRRQPRAGRPPAGRSSA